MLSLLDSKRHKKVPASQNFDQRFAGLIRFLDEKRMQEAALVTVIPREVEITFEQIVRQRETQILRIAFRIVGNWADAEDVAQEAFVRLHRNGMKFPSEAALGAWLHRVVVNLSLDRVRKSGRQGDLPADLAASGISAEAGLVAEEWKTRLAAALETLPARERAAIVLREMEGLSTAEVAEALGSSEGTVRSQISKAISHLRQIFGKERR